MNGKEMVRKMDVAATAGGPNRAVDLVFNNITPRNGVIDICFVGGDANAGVNGEAFIQAIEVGPGKVLSGLVARIARKNKKEVTIISSSELGDIENMIGKLQEKGLLNEA